jgi:NitT/TauT family transport system permease protein
MIASGELWKYLSQSLIALGAGLGIAAIFGIALGLVMARYWVIDIALDTYITALYSIPTVALVPVLVLWIGFDTSAKIVVVFLFTFFPIVINTYQGVKNVDAHLIEVGRAFRCNERQLWTNIVLPAAVPFIVAGLRLAIGRGLIGMVLADLYTAITGIGYLISRYASIYRTDAMFVPVVTLGILGITLTGLLRFVERRVAPWMHQPDRE